jgi:hypothetical protein
MPALQNTFKAELIKRYHNKYELRVTGDVTEPTTGWQVDLDPRTDSALCHAQQDARS